MASSYLPSTRFFAALGLLMLLGLTCFVWEWATLLWLGVVMVLFLGTIYDIVCLSRCHLRETEAVWDRQPTVQRGFVYTSTLGVFAPKNIRYQLESIDTDALSPSKRTAHLDAVTLPDDQPGVKASWEFFAHARGDMLWPGAYGVFHTRLKLLEKRQRLEKRVIPVYPNLMRDLKNQLNPELLMDQMGLKINRFLKSDQDFESLRPYVQGDNYRHIDWKASARMTSLITRQFQVEHHHNILVCLDASRLMGTVTEGISKLDWAIEATLHLAYLASRFQDRMGLVVFSNNVERWVKPVNYPVEAFMKSLYNVEPQIVEADFQQVCRSVLVGQKKRSLVIFLSDFLDASSLEPSLGAFAHLNRKHCSLFIGIEDPAYQRHLTQTNVDSGLEVTQMIVAQDSMRRRQAVLQQLRKMGLRALTVTPYNLVQQAMNAYLEIKFQGAI